jgi:hypothetical protein
MTETQTILVLSDIHYAAQAEKARGCPEFEIIGNPLLRSFIKAYRHYIWRRDPFAYNHFLDLFLERADDADHVVANGDYSCDTGFVGVCDEACFESVSECLGKLRERFGSKLHLAFGDHEIGKLSLVGGKGGMRLASWNRAQSDLGLKPFWRIQIGNYSLVAITSSLAALPVFEPEALPEERQRWYELREQHIALIREAFSSLKLGEKMILFCHDPTALPFLWHENSIRPKLSQLEMTIIGHLHSPLLLWKSRMLSGMPAIRVLGNSIRRMSTALNQARLWKHFNVRLCPALGGIELLKDGGYCRIILDPAARTPLRFEVMPLKAKTS